MLSSTTFRFLWSWFSFLYMSQFILSFSCRSVSLPSTLGTCCSIDCSGSCFPAAPTRPTTCPRLLVRGLLAQLSVQVTTSAASGSTSGPWTPCFPLPLFALFEEEHPLRFLGKDAWEVMECLPVSPHSALTSAHQCT